MENNIIHFPAFFFINKKPQIADAEYPIKTTEIYKKKLRGGILKASPIIGNNNIIKSDPANKNNPILDNKLLFICLKCKSFTFAHTICTEPLTS